MALTDDTVNEFVMKLSSKTPVPGGGGASALCGALGIALGGMVANYTIGKPKYEDVEEEIVKLKVAAYRVQQELLDAITKDADAFEPLAAAYRMSAETDDEKQAKTRIMEACLKDAAETPLTMMRLCAEAIGLLRGFAEHGSKLVRSDAACGVILCKAAMQSAWLNVSVNTKLIKDEAFALKVNRECIELMKEYLPIADEIYASVEKGYHR